MSKTVVEAHGEFVEMDETVVGTDSDVAGTDGAVVGTDGDVAGTLGDFVGRPGDAMETGDFRFEGLTPSDCGRLPEATRKVLVQLLRGPYVSQERHSKNWATL
ncbi:MAG: hypothetical protein LBI64_03390, partial [Coriobacteriales bacterium]|nr:hypothetical protein [Coriobacteriales bacterium]